jgi:DNA-binding beta-propeller fold protein YncE
MRRIRIALLSAALLCLLMTAAARGADSVYWSNYETPAISHANLSGGGGGNTIAGLSPTLEGPYGVAIDPTAGKVYWANFATDTIGYANLDGSGSTLLNTAGATIDEPAGLAIDPTAGRIYWANSIVNKISFANLNGSGGGDVNTTGATVNRPYGVAIYPAAGRIYWANFGGNTISYANLDGSGGGDVNTAGAPIDEPLGVAIDAATGKVYWPNFELDSIGFANLSGGGGQLDTGGAPLAEPSGLAIDPAAGRIYWANAVGNSIGFASLSGGGGGSLDTTGATLEYPAFPVLLEAPRGTQPPAVTRRPVPTLRAATASSRAAPSLRVPSHSARLSCSPGVWASDLLESLLYRAPQTFSYQWLRNGTEIAGATASTLEAKRVGKYSCIVTASNFAGAESQTSAPLAIVARFKLGRVAHNLDRGIATLPVAASGIGKVVLTGKGLVTERRRVRAGRRIPERRFPGFATSFVVEARGKAKKKLDEAGKVKVKAKVAYTPVGGKALKKTRTITLRKRIRP